jgi:hypothetical protein
MHVHATEPGAFLPPGLAAGAPLWGGVLLFAYTILEASFARIYKRSVEKCMLRIVDAAAHYTVPATVSEDITRQLSVMTHARTFYRDLFEVDHHLEIHRENLVKFLGNTMGAAQPVISYLISVLEGELSHQFPHGYNEKLQHAYCREDSVIRSVYVPAILKLPLVAIKFGCDLMVQCDYTKISTEHVVYWVYKGPNCCAGARPKALFFMCGIGIGPITYFYLLKHFYKVYDVIILCEIKWISFHLTADPVEDRILIQDIVLFLKNYLKEYPCFKGVSKENPNPSKVDYMAHSGGALYFKRLMDFLDFNNKILVEPACFMNGCSSATRQIYTYGTYNPLFQDPLIKNLPKLLDISETVLLTDTDTSNMFLVLSENDTLFNPRRVTTFIEKYHKHVPIFMVPNSGHGDAVAKHYDLVANLILKKLGFLIATDI